MLSLIHVELCFLEERTWESTIGRAITQLLEMPFRGLREGRGFCLFPFAILVGINAILGKFCTWQNSILYVHMHFENTKSFSVLFMES